ncbi:DUF5067 domain-containing protein [Macrococcus brunensis]|uniref:DUF5067 domain-containing protein n=1 Tax=Macrococcus brunensis TaxID=198483 RepID=A0A4R6BAS8_9STAP|nr:DUF5067 domain-containing protein [Macrococcus brunensis]TDL93403.1 DUF5067 domain-containing protein [Macrococcus brunensis]
MKKVVIISLIFLLILTACNRKSEEEQIKEGMDKAKQEATKKKLDTNDSKTSVQQKNKNFQNAPILRDNSVINNNYKIKVLRAKNDVEGNNTTSTLNLTFLTKNKSDAKINPLEAFNQTFSVIQEKEGSNIELEIIQTPPINSYQSKIEKQSVSINKNKTVISVISFKLNNLQSPIYIKSKNTNEVIIINPNDI